MEPESRAMLEANREKFKVAGASLRASHDEEAIRDVIEKVEELESESSSETAELLRFMTEIED